MGLPLDERQFDAVKVRARLERRIDEFLVGVQSLSAWCALWSSTSFIQYAGDALRGQACIELEVWRPVVEVIANLEGAKARARETAPCRDVAGSAPRPHRAANCGSAEDVNGLSFAELRLFMSSPLIGKPYFYLARISEDASVGVLLWGRALRSNGVVAKATI